MNWPDWLIFSALSSTDTPMFVPVLVPDGKRDALRQYLTDRNIYCPVHWPLSRLHAPDERLEKLLAGELSLVCDQRYTEQDIRRIAQAAADFLKGRGACSRF